MAYCVLCGKKVGLLDQIDLDFHGSKQVLCSACDVRMSKASPGERQDLEQQILASPHLQKADTVQANVNTGKVCPACGAILERKLEHKKRKPPGKNKEGEPWQNGAFSAARNMVCLAAAWFCAEIPMNQSAPTVSMS